RPRVNALFRARSEPSTCRSTRSWPDGRARPTGRPIHAARNPFNRRALGPIAAVEGPMEQLIDEFSHPTYTSFPVVAARMFLAAIFGAVIGFEREWRNRPAGLRT